jgi:glycine/D-amino acid oxidase-like deaminating enzyme
MNGTFSISSDTGEALRPDDGEWLTASDGMPAVGEVPADPTCCAVMDDGCSGFTFSMLATPLIAAAVLRKTLPEAALFAFKWSPME